MAIDFLMIACISKILETYERNGQLMSLFVISLMKFVIFKGIFFVFQIQEDGSKLAPKIMLLALVRLC